MAFSSGWRVRILILLLAASLPILSPSGRFDQRFHPDEAWYMTISRHAAVGGDWWLLAEPLDKPPLTYYANALITTFIGVDTLPDDVLTLDIRKGEFTGRLFSYWCSLIAVAGMGALLRASRRDEPSALLLFTASSLLVGLAATAFTDVPMLAFASLGLTSAACGQWRRSALFWVLSVAAKPQSVLLLPLVAGLAWRRGERWRSIRDGLPIGLAGVGLLMIWDVMRVLQGAQSAFLLGRARYPALELVPLMAMPERVVAWWSRLLTLHGTGLLTGSIVLLMILHAMRWRVDRPMWGWLAGYGLLHVLFTVNLFDRNQIVLLPISAWLFAGAVRIWRWMRGFAWLSLGLVAIGGAAHLPDSNPGGRFVGVIALAEHLNAKPTATVIYDRWLDWTLDYYLGIWNDKRRVFYPTPQALTSGIQQLDESGIRYWVAPTDVEIEHWLHAVQGIDWRVRLDWQNESFLVYALSPPDHAD